MKKILIVDDSAFMRNILKGLIIENSLQLCDEEVNIYEANSKLTALKFIKNESPDVVLLDIVMQDSEIEGLELVMEVAPFFDTSKIIMISSVGLPTLIEECKRQGVEAYLQKPFDPELVIETLKKILGRIEVEEE